MKQTHLKVYDSLGITRKVAWIFVPLVALGGLFYPVLGIIVIGIMVSMMVLGLLKGKFWCGNFCPHGSLFDFLLSRVSFHRRIPGFFRSPVLKWAFFAFFMAMFSWRLSGAFGYLGEPEFLGVLGSVFVNQYLVWPTIVGATLAVGVNSRTWCTFCPMGTMQQVMNRVGRLLRVNGGTEEFVSITGEDSCTRCGKCARACLMQLEPYRNWEDSQFKDEACIKCNTCVAKCPSKLLYTASSPSGNDERNQESLVV